MKNKKNLGEMIVICFIIVVIIMSIFALIYTTKSLFFHKKITIQQPTTQMSTISRMGLTPYDKELARKMMDKDNDGKCDACGMPVEMCMDSGQLQCNMDQKSTIGVLGSEHIHNDFRVYINGKALNFADPSYYMKSSFIHVDDNQNKEDSSGVLHMHATGVPLWIFFDSIKLELPESTKVYVNGELNQEGLNYVFNDLDKILITDGKGDITQQLNSITNFAKIH